MNNEEKLLLLQSFFNEINGVILDVGLDDDEVLEEITYICRKYRMKLHSHSVLQTLITEKDK
jgi:hypothetical protein